MFGNINFKRFDRASTMSGFQYNTDNNNRDVESNPHATSFELAGFNQHVNISNFMAEPVMLCANALSNPTAIKSLLTGSIRSRGDSNNCVVIKIYHSENTRWNENREKITQIHKTEIRIPGHMLNQGSIFIDELDCYLTTSSNLDATREMLAREVSQFQRQDSINIPSTMVAEDPATLYFQYKSLVDMCINHQDRINIRIGLDLRYGEIPDVIKNMHVAILDHYFVPFDCHTLVFDPHLGEDEFVIENLHFTSRQSFTFTFSELAKLQVIYLDHDKQETMFGEFYKMALFADKTRYAEYVYQRKAVERFDEETLFLAERSGDPRLKEEIASLQTQVRLAEISTSEAREEIEKLRAINKRLTSDVRDREQTIARIQEHHDAKMSAEVVMTGMENEKDKLRNDARKIENERVDQHLREKAIPLAHRAAILKNIGDIVKSGWGIATGTIAGVCAVLALLKKYNVRLTMG